MGILKGPDSLKKTVQTLSGNIDDIEKQISSIKSTKPVDMNKKIAVLVGQITAINKRIDGLYDLQKRLNLIDKKKETVKDYESSLKKDYSILKKEIDFVKRSFSRMDSHMAKDLSHIQTQLDSAFVANNHTEEFVKTSITGFGREINKTKTEIANVKTRLTDSFEKFGNLSNDIKELYSLKDSIHEYLASVEDIKRSFNNVIKTKDDFNSMFIELTNTSEELSKDFKEMKEAVELKDKENASQAKEFDKLIGNIDKNIVDVLKAKESFAKWIPSTENKIESFSKQLDKLEKFEDKITQISGEFEQMAKAKELMVKSADDAMKKVSESAIIVSKFDKRMKDLEKSMSSADKTLIKVNSEIDSFKDVLPKKDSIEKFIDETKGKVVELEHFYKHPEVWIEEKLDKWVENRLGILGKEVESLSQLIYKHRTMTKVEMIHTLIVSSMTQINTAQEQNVITSNISTIEFLFNEMKRHNIWDSELHEQILHSLRGTRDFWEARNSAISDAIQLGIDRLEQPK